MYVTLWVVAGLIALVLSVIPLVGIVLALLVLGLAGFVHFGMRINDRQAAGSRGSAPPRAHSPSADRRRQIVTGPPASARIARPVSRPSEHLAAPPTGSPVEPWSISASSIEVVGEAYRDAAFLRLFQGINISGYDGADLTLPAALADDAGNPHDRNAVAVWVGGHHVGYLDRDTARRWHPVVSDMASQHRHLAVRSRVWASTARGRVSARVTLYAPDPTMIHPVNGLPSGPHLVLPAGSTIQVTQEDRHMDVLAPFATGSDAPVAVTLHAIHEIRPRSAYEAVEVKIDGQRVGVLTRQQSENLLPLVKYIEDRAMVPVARATLKGNQLKADVVLHVVKAQDVDQAWLHSLGPAATPESRHTRPDFEWDD